jgi:hypothetical protein
VIGFSKATQAERRINVMRGFSFDPCQGRKIGNAKPEAENLSAGRGEKDE